MANSSFNLIKTSYVNTKDTKDYEEFFFVGAVFTIFMVFVFFSYFFVSVLHGFLFLAR